MALRGMPAWTIWYVGCFPPLVALTLLLAWRWGGTIELLVALVYLIGTDVQKAVASTQGIRFVHFEPVVATIDIAAFLTLAMLAYHRPRLWLLCSAALQFIACFGHVARALQPTMPALVYEILMGSSGYPLLVLLWMGIATNHCRRVVLTAR
jgi:hypothetical protein